MGAGGAAGAIIAARQKRIQDTIDAFRLSDATAATRARRLEEIGVMHNGELQDLIVEGVIVPGPDAGTYYLSEPGYIYRREDRTGMKVVVIVTLVTLIMGLGLFISRIAAG